MRVLWTRRRSHRPVIADVRTSGRALRVTAELQTATLLVAHMHPRRPHRERAQILFLGAEVETHAETSMRFKVWPLEDGRLRGYVTNIEVVPSKQRQGWAITMVRTLFDLYPDCVWTVEAPNEKSGQLFLALAQQHPDRVRPPLVDPNRPTDSPDRYGTNVWD